MQDQLHVDVLVSNPPSAGVSPSNTTTSSTPCHNLSQHMTVPSSGTVASRLKKMVHACNGTSPRCENGYTVWNADGLNIQRFPPIKYDRADSELLRIIAQYLKTIGLSETVKVLTLESGCTIENPLATKFREEVLTGDWSSAMESLEGLSNFVAKPWHTVEMRFLILERKYLELYESGRAVDALMVLRKDLMPLRYNKERLQELACLLMDCTRCVGPTMPNWETITAARNALMDKLQKYLPASVILPPRRLEALIHQAIELQWKKCLYHNIAGEPSLRRLGNDSLLLDHVCPDTDFPYETTQILTDHSDEVWFCRFSNSGKRLATGSKDGIVFIWEVDSTTRRLTKLFALEGHVFGASYFAWSPDDELLAVVGSEESADLWIWKMSDGTLHKKVTHSPDESISCVSWHSDGLRMVCGGTRGQFYLTDVEGNIVETWEGIRVRVAHCKHDGRNVLAADTHNRIRNYCFDDLTERTVIKEDASLMYFCIDKSERYALCSVAQQGLHLWDLETGTLVRRYRGGGQGYYTIFSCFGGANERYLASGSEEGNVYVWQRESEEAILVLKGHSGVVNAACWNPTDPSMLASCSDDGTVRIWGPVVTKDNTPNGNSNCSTR
ncbi:hypothetical protein M514_06049 [Trichuris suis]|nr:hypothetical protein M514_06049 [Trichuris suis]